MRPLSLHWWATPEVRHPVRNVETAWDFYRVPVRRQLPIHCESMLAPGLAFFYSAAPPAPHLYPQELRLWFCKT